MDLTLDPADSGWEIHLRCEPQCLPSHSSFTAKLSCLQALMMRKSMWIAWPPPVATVTAHVKRDEHLIQGQLS